MLIFGQKLIGLLRRVKFASRCKDVPNCTYSCDGKFGSFDLGIQFHIFTFCFSVVRSRSPMASRVPNWSSFEILTGVTVTPKSVPRLSGTLNKASAPALPTCCHALGVFNWYPLLSALNTEKSSAASVSPQTHALRRPKLYVFSSVLLEEVL